MVHRITRQIHWNKILLTELNVEIKLRSSIVIPFAVIFLISQRCVLINSERIFCAGPGKTRWLRSCFNCARPCPKACFHFFSSRLQFFPLDPASSSHEASWRYLIITQPNLHTNRVLVVVREKFPHSLSLPVNRTSTGSSKKILNYTVFGGDEKIESKCKS